MSAQGSGVERESCVVPDRPELTEVQRRELFEAAGRRVAAVVCGLRPEPLDEAIPDLAGRPVLGAFVSLKRAGQLRSCCGFLGNPVALGEAVAHAAVRAAKDDPRFPPIAPDELDQLDMDVWILWNLEPVPGRGADRVHGFQIGTHGLQIARGTSRGLLLPSVAVDHGLDAEGFLTQVCLKAHLPPDAWKDESTTLMRFEGYSIHGALPQVVRPPAQAGRFYPGEAAELDRELDALFSEPARPEPWGAALVPHAGWKYSGRLAAAVFSRVEFPEQVIVFCPKHMSGGSSWAVAPHDVWALPGRSVASDPALARRLATAVRGLELDAVPHRYEHAIEVQLPMIARLAPHTRVVGVTIRGGDPAALERFAGDLAEILRAMPRRPLLVVSSDMNHEASDAETRRRDRLALDAIEALDPNRLYRTVIENGISMCGMLPAVIVLKTLRLLGSLHAATLVDYATSADVTGDTGRAVGYAGVLFN